MEKNVINKLYFKNLAKKNQNPILTCFGTRKKKKIPCFDSCTSLKLISSIFFWIVLIDIVQCWSDASIGETLQNSSE